MENRSNEFGLAETGSLGHESHKVVRGSACAVSDIQLGPSQIDDLAVDRADLREWAKEQEVIDRFVSEAADWNADATFFAKRDHRLHEAIILSYPVLILLQHRRDEAEAVLNKHPASWACPKGLIRRNPAMAALALALKPADDEQRKTCSEWAYKLIWAFGEDIPVKRLRQDLENISLADAKKAVRGQRRAQKEQSGKAVRTVLPSIKIVIKGDHGSKTFKKPLEQDYYEALLAVNEAEEFNNAMHLLGALKNIRPSI